MPQSIGLVELQRLISAGAQLVDVLPEVEYRAAHLPGALNIPLKQLDGRTAKALDRSRAVVVVARLGPPDNCMTVSPLSHPAAVG